MAGELVLGRFSGLDRLWPMHEIVNGRFDYRVPRPQSLSVTTCHVRADNRHGARRDFQRVHDRNTQERWKAAGRYDHESHERRDTGKDGSSQDATCGQQRFHTSVRLSSRSAGLRTGPRTSRDVGVFVARISLPDRLLVQGRQVGLDERSKCLRNVETTLDQYRLTTGTNHLDIYRCIEQRVRSATQRACIDPRQVRHGYIGIIHLSILVAKQLGPKGEDVGHGFVRVATTERFQIPIGLDGRQSRVMRHVGVVCSVLEARRNRSSESNREDAVGSRVAIVLIEREQNKRTVVVELGLLKHRGKEIASPVGEEGGCRIMAIINHVWGDEVLSRFATPIKSRIATNDS